MGKAARWFKGFLGMKKGKETPPANSNENDRREKRRWSFARPGKDSVPPLAQIPVNIPAESGWLRTYLSETEKEQNKHAIAVAAATAAAADAAVAAAQAAVAVVRLTSHGRTAAVKNKPSAAVKIQTVFRGYLARKALRALKGLVKLQAHVRGYLVRKQATATLRSMQALVRAQAAARSHRARRSITKDGSGRTESHSKRLSASYDPYDETPKIVEIDTYKPNSRSSRRIGNYPNSVSDYSDYPTISSPLPPGRISIPDWGYYDDDDHQCHHHRVVSAYSTPRYANTFRSHGPPTPAKSVCGEGYHFRPYYDHHVHHHSNGHYYYPNYMTNTQSFRAKVRSQSAPRQRPAAPSPSRKRMSLNEVMAARSSVSGVRMQRSCSSVQEEALHF